MKLLIIIPAYNEELVIADTIKSIVKQTTKLSPSILVVDDGSVDQTNLRALSAGVYVARHRVNRGLGGAIGTGLEYARRNGFDLAVTIDADGQHHPSDVEKVIKPLLARQADVVIGSRLLGNINDMPVDRRFMLRVSNWLTYILFGQHTSDSLSGFRAFNKKALRSIRLKTERMEVSNEFFSEIKRLRLRLTEVPIRVIYTDYSKAKGQTNLNSLNVIWKLLIRLFR